MENEVEKIKNPTSEKGKQPIPSFDEYLQEKLSKINLKQKIFGGIIIGIFFCFLGLFYLFSGNKSLKNIFFIPIIFGAIIILTTLLYTNKQKSKMISKITKQAESEYNQLIIQSQYSEDEFKTTKAFVMANVDDFVLLDSNKKSFIVRLNGNNSEIISAEKIISYKVIEDGQSVAEGTAGTALIGGLLFGVTGALIGANASQTINQNCTTLKLLINLNYSDFPLLELTFIDKTTQKQSDEYKNAVNKLNQLVSYLELFINGEKQKETKKIPSNQKLNIEHSSTKEKLKELKDLLDEGIITNEEYETKRKDIIDKM